MTKYCAQYIIWKAGPLSPMHRVLSSCPCVQYDNVLRQCSVLVAAYFVLSAYCFYLYNCTVPVVSTTVHHDLVVILLYSVLILASRTEPPEA
jgi:hypothetical protein